MSTTAKVLLSAAHAAIFYYGFQLQRNDKELSDINTIGFSIYCSRGAALCLAFDMALIMLPMCRKLLSYVSRIVFALFHVGQGTLSEGNNSNTANYHKLLAYHILFFLTVHVLGHCVNFYRLEQLGKGSAMSYHFGTWAGVTGYWMLLILGIMFVTAHKKIRKRHFEVFWYTHHLALVCMGMFAFHGYGCFVKTNEGQCRGYGSWRYIVLASVIYLVERALRALESRPSIPLSLAIAHPGGAIELNFKDPSLHYRPGQHLYLNIPQLSKFEWHPFTITSSPIESTISLHIRQDGDWTIQLGQLLGHGPGTPRLEQAQAVRDRSLLPEIRIDGPYGGPKEDVLNFDHVVLVGTGNGITTFSGILRHIWFRHQETQSSRLKTLDLYWVSRDANKLDWFQSLFSMERTMELFRTGLIRIHIYFTSTSSRRKPTIKRGSMMSRSKSQDSSHSLPLLRTEGLAQGRYSEDDEDGEEHDDLLSPLDRPIGSSSLISLTSIHSPPSHSPTTFSGGATEDAYTRSLEGMEQGEGDAIIGPDNIHLGRPNFTLEFDNMRAKWTQGDTSSGRQVKVGVFYCGSPGLGRILGRECQRVSTSKVKFSFVEE
ncbi:MAG: ferric reductase NAD binding domain-containing protein [Linnemannia elongata]|nr:MAG: ferric reductase NAD binding domain-containing protein [Linnemannia elongata]